MPTSLRALPLMAAFLVAGPAMAQTEEDLSLSLTQNPFTQVDDSYYVSIEDCAGQLGDSFSLTGKYAGATSDYTVRLTLTDGGSACAWSTFGDACSGTVSVNDGTTCYCLSQTTASELSASFTLGGLLGLDCDALTQEAYSETWRFFVQYHATDPETVDIAGTSLDISFDFVPPAQPDVAPTVVPVEAGLEVSFAESNNAEVDGYEVCYKLQGGAGAAAGATGNVAAREGYTCSTASGGQTKRLSGLENGVVYSVVYATVDRAGNRSANSPAATGTPEESYDFAEWYHSRNGPASGGCAVEPGQDGSSVGLLLLGLLVVVGRRRMRLAALLALVLVPMAAHAQRGQTLRTAAVELRAGSFMPDLDKTFPSASCKASGQCPYEAVFKNDDPLMLMVLVDKHIIVDYGTLSIGGGLGYWNVEGHALLGANASASDTTELTVVPMQLQLTYHFDFFQDYVPLVPVLRAGLDYYYWRILDGKGEVASFEPGDKAQGGTLGYHYTLGVHVLLDFFSPEMAADFDRDAGVNNSYITFEYQKSDITNFGANDAFRLGSEVFFFGLGLDL